jgi:hypothetical protein
MAFSYRCTYLCCRVCVTDSLGGGGLEHAKKATRDPVGRSDPDKLRWLSSKIAQWDTEKLLYELTGPNAENWVAVCDSDDVKVLRSVLELLSRKDVNTDSRSAPLFLPFGNSMGLARLLQYVTEGKLSEDSVDLVSNGRGGHQWSECVDSVSHLVDVLCLVMSYFQANVVIRSILDALKARVEVLAPQPPADTLEDTDEQAALSTALAAMEPWHRECAVPDRAAQVARGKFMTQRLESAIRMFVTLKANEREKKLAKEQKEAMEERLKSDARTNMRQGQRFLNDIGHDRDFLHMSVVPTPEQLLAQQATRLPQNLVLPSRKRGNNDNAEEDCMDEASSSAVSEIPLQFQYRSVDHYLNTHFLLLFEDCVSELRRAISEFRGQLSNSEVPSYIISPPTPEALLVAVKSSMKKHNGARFNMYTKVAVKNLEQMRQGLGFTLTFSLPTDQKVDWSHSSRFMTGSLLCLSADGTFNASTLVVATVMRCVQLPKDGNKKFVPTITVAVDAGSVGRFNVYETFTMIESPVFFEAYRPVLSALQQLACDSVPMIDLLLGRTNKVEPPEYLVNAPQVTPVPGRSGVKSDATTPAAAVPTGWQLGQVFPAFPADPLTGHQTWNPLLTDSRGKKKSLPYFDCEPGLDDSQRAAIALALSSRIALIQGPPGCGKTFVGVLITKILLANRHLRANRPIVFICQTNHALDQILEHVYTFEKNIIRIGGRSESDIMQGLSLQAVQNANPVRCNRSQDEFDTRDRVAVLYEKIKSDVSQIGLTKNKTGVMSLNDSHLARLRALLQLYDKEEVIDNLLDQAPRDWQHRSFLKLQSFIDSKAKSSKNHQQVPVWAQSFADWLDLSTTERIWMMSHYSEYSISTSGVASEFSLFDAWLSGGKDLLGKSLISPSDGQQEGPLSMGKGEMEVDADADLFPDRDLCDDTSDDDIDYFDAGMEPGLTRAAKLKNSATNRPVNIPLSQLEDAAQISPGGSSLLNSPLLSDPHKLTAADRVVLAEALLRLLSADGASESQSNMEKYKEALKDEAKYFARVDALTLKNAAVVGLTTTGAAKYGATLRALGSQVLLVEVLYFQHIF